MVAAHVVQLHSCYWAALHICGPRARMTATPEEVEVLLAQQVTAIEDVRKDESMD